MRGVSRALSECTLWYGARDVVQLLDKGAMVDGSAALVTRYRAVRVGLQLASDMALCV